MSDSQITQRKRSKYSRAGCMRCKQMKVKCDEGKPRCSRCSKRDHNCVYVVQALTPLLNEHDATKLAGAAMNKKEQYSAPREKNFFELIEDDFSTKMDQALDQSLTDRFVASPYEDQDLASHLNVDQIRNLKPYFQFEEVINPTKESLLSSGVIFVMPLELFSFIKDPVQRKYFELFYNEFAQILMPLRSDNDRNIIRDMLLHYSLRKDYLFFAILSTAARLSFSKSALDEDKFYYTKYMKKTLEMLNDFTLIQNYCSTHNPTDLPDTDMVTQKLEPLLLTVLLLTSDNASSMTQSWRGHLKGAKELLKRTFVEDRFPKTRTLMFCKFWFTSFEILAGLTAPYGGTLKEDVEINKLMYDVSNHNEAFVLEQFNASREDGFNYILGFNEQLLPSLVKLIEEMKKPTVSLDFKSIFELLSELVSLKKLSVKPSSSYFCWYKTCHQSYVDAAILTVLSKFLNVPITNNAIQELVHGILGRILQGLTSMPIATKSEYILMLVQWPLLCAGLNCSASEDKKRVVELFELLTSLGSGSAKYSLEKVQRKWANVATVGEEIDIVTY